MIEGRRKLTDAGNALLMLFIADEGLASFVVEKARQSWPYVRHNEATALDDLQKRASAMREESRRIQACF